MKFIVSSSSLLKHLQLVSGVLNTSNTLPILDDFLFEAEENSLRITASDLETTVVTTFTIESKEEGEIAIPAKLLLDILKSFPENPLTFTIDRDNQSIEITSDYGKYKLTGHEANEFPKTPEVESPIKVKIDSDALVEAVGKTIFATGNDELRPVMSGVYFQLDKNGTTFVATDAHKLVKYHRSDAKSEKATAFIMPKKPLNLLRTLLAGKEAVSVEFNETNARFKFENTILVCRLIDGKYPNYEAVIPKQNPNKLTMSRTVLLNSVKRVSIFSSKTTHQVRLKITGSELQLSAEDLDFANEATERLTCQYDGEDIEIGFNSVFLIEMLSNLKTEEINLELSEPNRAGILKPVEMDDNEDILMLVMPVMLNT
ncbi:MAG TPA: DNA polymerase III subunit beta [Flavobacteriales bacterium]|nr:DNA polymerase III subunit beta [Flavobacteriales bacterium]